MFRSTSRSVCIFSSVLGLNPFPEEAWARKVWKRCLLKRMVRVELERVLFHGTTKFCSWGPFVCIPEMACYTMLSWDTFVEENVVTHAHPAMNFLRGGSWGVVSSIQERLILNPYVTELVNLPVCDLQCLTSLCIVFLAGFEGVLRHGMECIYVKTVRIWQVAVIWR